MTHYRTITERAAGAEAALSVLQGLSAEAPAHVIAGSFGTREAAEVHETSGRWPALVGQEYCAGFGIDEAEDASAAVPWRTHNPALIEHAREGALIRLLTHFPNPTRRRYGGLRDNDADIDAILAPGTPERQRWIALMDEVAAGLADLDAHGATVIYGPLHEMNCGGFWWGVPHERMSAAAYRSLWRDLYDHVMNRRKCRNVLWLFAPLAHDPLDMAVYPGDDVVDLVGLDAYSPTLAPFVDTYRKLAAVDKPFVLSEFGPLRWDAMPGDEYERYDCRRLLEEIGAHFPRSSAFMFWGEPFAAACHDYCRELMADERVLDRAGFVALRGEALRPGRRECRAEEAPAA
jgi:mannan endo-1,4-beta-mannosidase